MRAAQCAGLTLGALPHQALGKVRELLTTQMQQAQDNDAKVLLHACLLSLLGADVVFVCVM